jgi:hypothetical protein
MAKKTTAKKTTKKTKNEIGRPSKIHAFIEALKDVLSVDEFEKQIIFLTDAELVFVINQKLKEKERITDMTFRRWKAKNTGEDVKGVEPLDEVGKEFCSVYKSALIRQKAALFKKLLSPSEGQWQRYAWIIERKFDDWNIRHKTEVDATVKAKAITIVKNYGAIEKK